MEELAKRVGEKIRQVRESKGMSQAALARALKVPPPTVHQYEHGSRTPSLDAFERIVITLGVSADFLLGVVESKEFVSDEGTARLFQEYRNLLPNERQMYLELLRVVQKFKE